MAEDRFIQLQLPCDPQYVGVVRLFLASAGRHFGVDEDAIDDLKVAVSEACNGAIDANHRNGIEGPMQVALSADDDSLAVEVTAEGGSDILEDDWDPATPTHVFQRTIAMGLVLGLFPDAQWEEESESGMRVTFRVPRTGAANG